MQRYHDRKGRKLALLTKEEVKQSESAVIAKKNKVVQVNGTPHVFAYIADKDRDKLRIVANGRSRPAIKTTFYALSKSGRRVPVMAYDPNRGDKGAEAKKVGTVRSFPQKHSHMIGVMPSDPSVYRSQASLLLKYTDELKGTDKSHPLVILDETVIRLGKTAAETPDPESVIPDGLGSMHILGGIVTRRAKTEDAKLLLSKHRNALEQIASGEKLATDFVNNPKLDIAIGKLGAYGAADMLKAAVKGGVLKGEVEVKPASGEYDELTHNSLMKEIDGMAEFLGVPEGMRGEHLTRAQVFQFLLGGIAADETEENKKQFTAQVNANRSMHGEPPLSKAQADAAHKLFYKHHLGVTRDVTALQTASDELKRVPGAKVILQFGGVHNFERYSKIFPELAIETDKELMELTRDLMSKSGVNLDKLKHTSVPMPRKSILQALDRDPGFASLRERL